MKKNQQTGKIIPNGIKLEPHEYDTILFLTTLSKTIKLIPPSNTPNKHNAGFFMDGLIWEAKSPTGNSTRMTIDRILHKAAKQSENIIIDLRRTKLPDKQSLLCIEKHFKLSRRIRRLTRHHQTGKANCIYEITMLKYRHRERPVVAE